MVSGVSPSCSTVLLETCDCDCVDPGVPHRLSLVTVKQARGSTQGLRSGHLTGSQIRGAQLAPHAWLAHDPEGQDPCLGHVQSCDPLTNWWEGDSHVLMKQQLLHLQTAVQMLAGVTYSPIRTDLRQGRCYFSYPHMGTALNTHWVQQSVLFFFSFFWEKT